MARSAVSASSAVAIPGRNWWELRWPAPSQTLADLETLANAGLQADLCSSYADFWPEGALTPASEAYLTALARLMDGEWLVRIALVQD